MPINRTLWKAPFRKGKIPTWPCPRCQTGFLRLQDGTFKYSELATSTRPINPEDWDPIYETYTYSAMLECANESCKEHVSSCGQGEVIEDYYPGENGDIDTEYYDLFTPEYFYPPLAVFNIPRACPDPVAEEIRLSFRLFFCDPASSANHIRKSVENILTDKDIKRFQGSKGKRIIISLHQRIKLYEAKDKDIAERLFAIKWLGNVGSHAGELTKDDVLDAYEILETVLDDLYIGHGKSVKKKVALVNKRKGPLKKRNE